MGSCRTIEGLRPEAQGGCRSTDRGSEGQERGLDGLLRAPLRLILFATSVRQEIRVLGLIVSRTPRGWSISNARPVIGKSG